MIQSPRAIMCSRQTLASSRAVEQGAGRASPQIIKRSAQWSAPSQFVGAPAHPDADGSALEEAPSTTVVRNVAQDVAEARHVATHAGMR
jgi:hypothetical protein